jgi:hypothetical protein
MAANTRYCLGRLGGSCSAGYSPRWQTWILVDRFIYQGFAISSRRHAVPDQDLCLEIPRADEKRSLNQVLTQALLPSGGRLRRDQAVRDDCGRLTDVCDIVVLLRPFVE